MDNRKSILACVLASLSVFVCTQVALTDGKSSGVDGGFDLSWNTVDGGGGTSSGSGFQIDGTLGQPDASTTVLTGGGFALTGGFWPGATPIPTPTCAPDIAPPPTGDGMVNVNDLLAVINNWGPCPVPPAVCWADITNDGNINVNDLLAVINGWGVCP